MTRKLIVGIWVFAFLYLIFFNFGLFDTRRLNGDVTYRALMFDNGGWMTLSGPAGQYTLQRTEGLSTPLVIFINKENNSANERFNIPTFEMGNKYNVFAPNGNLIGEVPKCD